MIFLSFFRLLSFIQACSDDRGNDFARKCLPSIDTGETTTSASRREMVSQRECSKFAHFPGSMFAISLKPLPSSGGDILGGKAL